MSGPATASNLVEYGDYLEHVGQYRASMSAPTVRTLLPVIDCPRCAWRDFGATGLDRDFFGRHEDRLNETGRELIRQPLIEAWRRRGFRVQLVCHHDCAADPGAVDDPPDEVFIAVRQEAADAVEDAELVFAAGLSDEYRRAE